MAQYVTRRAGPIEADNRAKDYKAWPFTRLCGVEIELTNNHTRSSWGSRGCEDRCSNGTECEEDGCEYCHDPACGHGSDGESRVDAVVNRYEASVVGDGSVSPNGIEIVTRPVAGPYMVRMISDLMIAARADGLRANGTCGVHVHVDGRDLTWYDIRRVILAYAITEPYLLAIVPRRRRNGRYSAVCGERYLGMLTRCGDTVPLTKRKIIGNLYGVSERDTERHRGMEFKRAKEAKYHSVRYHALNLHSWIHRGTLEWRLPPGSARATRILGYARTFLDLVAWSQRTSERDLWSLADAYSDGSLVLRDPAYIKAVRRIWSSPWTHQQYLRSDLRPVVSRPEGGI